jgi:threonine dehydratase
MNLLPTRAELDAAATIVYGAMPATPQFSWPLLNEALGTEAWVKHENHTPTGAFKVRGGLVYLAGLLKREPGVSGIVSATRGNHGQSLAFAARRHGVKVTIVVPHGNSVEKNAAMRGLGAELIEYGDDFQASREYALSLARNQGLHMVPSYHRDLVAGVASYWMELFHAQAALDTVFVPIGMGSGFAAAIAAREALGLRTRVIGVVSSHAPAYLESFRSGELREAPAATELADGMACRTPDAESLEVVRRYADDVIAVSDEEVARAIRLYYRATHNLAEGAGAAALAAALRLKHDPRVAGCKVGLPLTGANVDAEKIMRVLSEVLP